ncbi:ABC transporter ATP-binding protein [Shewanella woodyi]|uniref:ABC transporter related n=1 Tax=Shewanella woodyi (strain ATCC 51908 / MS32) TaxID=392500 RepID=B1KK69_SHEWM|nr:ABC transporter ATP-binding protein [Shewanella woodyi]ACA88700.1 ABC transporter related [Shewanella woodyi ATCC 51908]
MGNSAVSVNEVSHHFGDFSALRQVSFSVEQGQTMALLGHNGAGKSTLIKIILGLITPESGEVSLMGAGQCLSSRESRVRLGYLPENVSFYDKLTGEEILTYFAALKGVTKAKVATLIEEFGLGYAKNRQLKTYSKGMKQRLGFAQAILSEPDILMLDEPTVGLDPQASQFLYGKIAELKKTGCAVIVCTHELSLIEPHIDMAMIMAKGERLALGDLNQLRLQSGLKIELKCDGLAQVVKQEPSLLSLYQDDALHFDVEQQEQVVRCLTSQYGKFDFSLSKPGLTQIYRHFIGHDMDSHIGSELTTRITPKESILTRLSSQFLKMRNA